MNRCIENFHDIHEPNGKLVGRASLAGSSISGFGFDLGVLVHKGLVMGSWRRSGILLSGNNADLARSQAQPVCSAGALSSWASTIFDHENKNSPWLSNVFLSLGLSVEQLNVAGLADEYITPEKIGIYLQQNELDEIFVVLEAPDCPDEMSKAKFNQQFKFYEDVIVATSAHRIREDFGLEGWISSLFPEIAGSPRTALSAIEHSIRQAWPTATSDVKERVVGVVDDEEITAKCWVFRKIPNKED